MRAMGLTRSWARTGCLLSSWWHGIRMDEEKQLHVDIFYLCLWRNWGVSKIYSDLGESRWLWEPFYFQVAHGKVKMYGYLWILCRMYCSRKNKKVFNETQVSTQWSHVNTYIFWLNVSCMLRITWCACVWNLLSHKQIAVEASIPLLILVLLELARLVAVALKWGSPVKDVPSISNNPLKWYDIMSALQGHAQRQWFFFHFQKRWQIAKLGQSLASSPNPPAWSISSHFISRTKASPPPFGAIIGPPGFTIVITLLPVLTWRSRWLLIIILFKAFNFTVKLVMLVLFYLFCSRVHVHTLVALGTGGGWWNCHRWLGTGAWWNCHRWHLHRWRFHRRLVDGHRLWWPFYFRCTRGSPWAWSILLRWPSRVSKGFPRTGRTVTSWLSNEFFQGHI